MTPRRCPHCGHDPDDGAVVRSVVVDHPGRPVAAPCAVSGCQYNRPNVVAEFVSSARRRDRTAAALRRLRADVKDESDVRERLADLLRRTAIALKGPEPPLVAWDWSDLPARTDELVDLASRLLDMVERVEWIRSTFGRLTVCPFCHAVSERDGGPGHQDDCEWQLVTRAGNDLRIRGILR